MVASLIFGPPTCLGRSTDDATSRHLVIPYSPTQVPHGVLLYALLLLVAGRLRRDARLVVTIALERFREVVET